MVNGLVGITQVPIAKNGEARVKLVNLSNQSPVDRRSFFINETSCEIFHCVVLQDNPVFKIKVSAPVCMNIPPHNFVINNQVRH